MGDIGDNNTPIHHPHPTTDFRYIYFDSSPVTRMEWNMVWSYILHHHHYQCLFLVFLFHVVVFVANQETTTTDKSPHRLTILYIGKITI